ncbi:UDP-N-acetylenolpyruvoylglucosamine reductase [Opitutaceae bacterium EW11]|nr:UDP-N-acetylenolpyruvoylglucosamine reductase [Opitutaceae bacterium EW11]
MRREPLPLLFSRDVAAIHCVGVAGMGVGPLAIYLAQRGFRVSGEDDGMTEAMRDQLQAERIILTPPGAIPPECELVAYSSAISEKHPAYIAARARGLPLVRRGELLAEVTRDKKLVAICGSHGKTTTTAMLITAVREAGFPAGYVLGGLFNDASIAPARAGSNEWVIAEIDESDGTIDRFSPEITVATNLDWDHPDRYRRLEDIQATFEALFRRTHLASLLNDACALSARIAARPEGKRFLSFGRTGEFRSRIEREHDGLLTLGLNGCFPLASATVRAQGEFNASNATAALAAAHLMGVPLSSSLLADYPGVRRRQTVLHAADGITVLDDYAHHPAEIRALLASLRRRASGGGLLVVFQPHRFSRTAQFKGEFAAALAGADRVYLLDVYGAGEGPISGGTTADLYAELRGRAPSLPVVYTPGHPSAALQSLGLEAKAGDVIAFVGAGDIDQHAHAWVTALAERNKSAERWDDLAVAFIGVVSTATKVKREEPLAEKTTMRVGGAARIYAEPASAEDLGGLLRTAGQQGVPVFVLGRGSNLIVPDEGVDGLVISLNHAAWQTFDVRSDGRVWVGAGLRLKNLCGLAKKAGFAGFEFLEGIPGAVGGALRMNAGAMGGWMFDVVDEVQLMTRGGDLRVLKKAQMHVDYRHCSELDDAIALGALLQPRAAAVSDDIGRQIDTYRDKRQKTQPREPSAGCIFKNPPGNSAGRLIDEAGLKGERVGDAEVSPVHANFIVNVGHATSADIIELVRRVRARVEEVKGVKLEPEVMLYGKKWKDVL